MLPRDRFSESRFDHIWAVSRGEHSRNSGLSQNLESGRKLSKVEENIEDPIVVEGVEADVFINGRDRGLNLDRNSIKNFGLDKLGLDLENYGEESPGDTLLEKEQNEDGQL